MVDLHLREEERLADVADFGLAFRKGLDEVGVAQVEFFGLAVFFF